MRTLTSNNNASVNEDFAVNVTPFIRVNNAWYSANTDLQPFYTSGRLQEVSQIQHTLKSNYSGAITTASCSFIDADHLAKDTLDDGGMDREWLCYIYYWFYGNTPNDLISILKGYIAEPISWDESSHIFSCDIVSTYREGLCGYIFDVEDFNESEEIECPYSESNGRLWPIVFGDVEYVPLFPVQRAPEGFLKKDITNDSETVEIGSAEPLKNNEVFIAGVLYDISEDGNINEANKKIFSVDSTERPEEYEKNRKQVKLEDDNVFLVGRFVVYEDGGLKTLNYCVAQNGAFCSFLIDWHVPRDQDQIDLDNMSLDVYGAPIEGCWNYKIIMSHLKEKLRTEKRLSLNNDDTFTICGGAKVVENTPSIYAANYFGCEEISNVFFENEGFFLTYPHLSYDVKNINLPTGTQGTIVSFNEPLQLHGFSTQAMASIKSSKGSNSTEAIRTLLGEFTDYQIDETTFDSVASYTENYPANFTITEPSEVIATCEDIAWQSRCGVVIKPTDYICIYYLSKDPTPDYTITDSIIEADSIVFSYVDVYDISSNFLGRWKPNHISEERIEYYKDQDPLSETTQSYDFWIYNIKECVTQSLQFWGKRLSSLWTYVSLRTFHKTIALELYDCVDFNLTAEGLVANGIKGIVEGITYDFNDDGSISLKVWLPVEADE